jgi:hypothetical protein
MPTEAAQVFAAVPALDGVVLIFTQWKILMDQRGFLVAILNCAPVH